VWRDDRHEMTVKGNDSGDWISDGVVRGGKIEMRLTGGESGQS
jgi:hypothetical protein